MATKHDHAQPVDPLAAGIADVGADAGEASVEFEDGLVEVINEDSRKVTFKLDGRKITMPPKSKTRVPRAYGVLRVGVNAKGDKLPSVIALDTGGKVQPVDKSQRMEIRG